MHKEHPSYEPLQQIYQAGLRARDLTRQLLAFSRKQILEVTLVDVNSVVTGFEKLLRRLIGEDVQMNLALTSELLPIRADTAQLEQVLMNLAVNARDAMPDGGALNIETRAVELDEAYAGTRPGVIPGDYALISINDTGCGMGNEIIEHIFEPFFTTKDKDKGTGLGLSTCYGIVKQHGGNIWVYSEPGQGTTFNIYLPLAAREDGVNAQAVQQLSPVRGAATVMIVEDDPIVRNLVSRILAERGYRVMVSDNVADAVDQARKCAGSEPIHLVLADVVMPDMKGPEVFQKIAEYHPEVRVIFMSGYTDDVVVRYGIQKDAVAFIQKPFTVSGLLEKCQQVLHGA